MAIGFTKYAILLFMVCSVTAGGMEAQPTKDFLPGIQNAIPMPWTCQVSVPSDSQDWPRGIFKPLFNASFVDTVHLITDCMPQPSYHPNLRICFYPDSLRDTIEAIIERQSIFSWCIPVKYLECAKYFIVTSPCYINNGCFTSEAQKLISPLDSALAGYFNPKQTAGLEINPDSSSLSLHLIRNYPEAIDTIIIKNCGDKPLSIDTVAIKFLNGATVDFRCGINCKSFSDYNYSGWTYGFSSQTLRYRCDSLFLLQDSDCNLVKYAVPAHDSMKFILRIITNCPICGRMPSFPTTTSFKYDFIEKNGGHNYFILNLKNATGTISNADRKSIRPNTQRKPPVNLRGQTLNSLYPAAQITAQDGKKIGMMKRRIAPSR
jgi:hypothetical protein